MCSSDLSNANAADKRPKGADPMANYYGNTFVFNAGAPGKYPGARVRHTFYNRDGTYEEMGFVGQGPGPLQEGTWFWDADGHNCQLHEFPLDERANVVCHAHVAHAIGKVELETPAGGGTPSKVVIVPGQVRPGETPYDQPGGAD